MQWTKTFGGTRDDIGHSIQQTNDGGFIIGSSTVSFDIDTLSSDDIYLLKTNSSGQLLWSKTYGGTNQDGAPLSVQQTNDGGFIVIGETKSFGAGYQDIYLIKTDSLGNSSCNEYIPNTFVSSGGSQGTGTTVQGTGGGILTTPVFQTGSGGTETTLCITTGVDTKGNENSISVFPNPTTGQFQIQIDSENEFKSDGYRIEIVNMLGEKVYSSNIRHQVSNINISDKPTGIYFLHLKSNTKTYNQKVIKK